MIIGFEDIQSFMTVLVALCAVLVTVWGGVKAIKEALKPLTDLAQRVDETDEKLDNDNRRIKDLERSSRLTLKAIDQLIEHEITDNHYDKLKEVQVEIREYLYSK